MRTTAEVRWFGNGPIEDAIFDWFHQTEFTPGVEIREDRYLVFVDCASVGVKLREDAMLQIKALRDPPRTVTYPRHVLGRSDTWVKWTASQPLPRALLGELVEADREWFSLGKRRWTRLYATKGAVPEEVPHDRPIDQGCAVELVEILHGHSVWWSLAFEAFGPADQVPLLLQHTGDRFFQFSPPPVALTSTHSFSYPAWLSSLPRRPSRG